MSPPHLLLSYAQELMEMVEMDEVGTYGSGPTLSNSTYELGDQIGNDPSLVDSPVSPQGAKNRIREEDCHPRWLFQMQD